MKKQSKLTEEFLIEEYCRKGKRITDIANELGYAVSTVSVKVKQYGLKQPTENKYIGHTFGELTPMQVYGYDESSHLILECKCKCGKILPVLAYSLATGNTSSCGCTSRKLGENHKNFKGYKEIGMNYWRSLEKGARSRGLSFEITIEEAWELYLKQNRKCALSGININFAESRIRKKFSTASLDRKDSSKGYTKNNIQWIHKRINYMKQNMSDEDLVFWCILISDHSRGKNIDNSYVEQKLKESYTGISWPGNKTRISRDINIETAYDFGLKNRNTLSTANCIPLWLFGKSNEIIITYINGLFDNEDILYATSLEYVESLAKLMKKVDIKSEIYLNDNQYGIKKYE